MHVLLWRRRLDRESRCLSSSSCLSLSYTYILILAPDMVTIKLPLRSCPALVVITATTTAVVGD